MTDAPHQPSIEPSSAIFGGSSSALKQSISADLKASDTCDDQADPTARKIFAAYDLSNDTDSVGKAFLELLRAHHAFGRRNVEQLAVSMQTLATAKTPAEFAALQQRLLAKSIAAAVSDSAVISELTTAAFTAAFEPKRRKIGELKGGAKRQE